MGKNSFLQILEGPADLIQALYKTISEDKRHTNINRLCDESVEARLFSDWSMKSDNYNQLEWSNPTLNAGDFVNISVDAAKNIFTRISEQSQSIL